MIHEYSTFDFPNGAIAPVGFESEVRAAGLSNLSHTDGRGDLVTVTFTVALTDPQIATLDGVVAAHQGVRPPDTEFDLAEELQALRQAIVRLEADVRALQGDGG